MLKFKSASFVVAVVILIFGFSELPLNAQQSTESGKQQVFSANPFGLLFQLFNAEYERVISETSTIGFGGSTLRIENETDYDWEPDPITETDRYINFDLFWRFYPSGNPLVGTLVVNGIISLILILLLQRSRLKILLFFQPHLAANC